LALISNQKLSRDLRGALHASMLVGLSLSHCHLPNCFLLRTLALLGFFLLLFIPEFWTENH
jgi:hypothetical protein